jgi:hypothetical protein
MSPQELLAQLDADLVQLNNSPTTQPTPHEPFIHNFSNLDWQTEEEPPYPANPAYPKPYYLLTIFSTTVVGYYPHDTHTLDQPNPHYIAWAEIPNPTQH